MEQHTAAPSSFMEPTTINQHSQVPNASPSQGEWAKGTMCTLCAGGSGVVVNRYIYSCSPVQETSVYVSTMGVAIFTVVVFVWQGLWEPLSCNINS